MTCETKYAFLGGFPGRWTDDPGRLMDTASCEEEQLPALKVRVEEATWVCWLTLREATLLQVLVVEGQSMEFVLNNGHGEWDR